MTTASLIQVLLSHLSSVLGKRAKLLDWKRQQPPSPEDFGRRRLPSFSFTLTAIRCPRAKQQASVVSTLLAVSKPREDLNSKKRVGGRVASGQAAKPKPLVDPAHPGGEVHALRADPSQLASSPHAPPPRAYLPRLPTRGAWREWSRRDPLLYSISRRAER